jgi:hypothetical protein
LFRLRRRLYCKKKSPKMVFAFEERQFWHEWHSALGVTILCIWWDMEWNLTVTAESYCQQLRRLEDSIQQKRPGRRHGVILQHDNARPHTANMTKAAIQELDWDCRFFHTRPTLRTLPHRITTSSALSPTICPEFPSRTTLSSKIGSTTSSRPNWRISSSVGSKTCPNVGRWSWIMEENI